MDAEDALGVVGVLRLHRADQADLVDDALGGGPVVGQWYLRAPDSTFVSAIDAVAGRASPEVTLETAVARCSSR